MIDIAEMTKAEMAYVLDGLMAEGVSISPTMLAERTLALWGHELPPEIRYTCLEHLKTVARQMLRERFDISDNATPESLEAHAEALRKYRRERAR